jgi:DNA-binding MarR family transcriptional regulator
MKPKHQHDTPPASTSIDDVIAAYDAFMHRLMATHAPEVNAMHITMAQAKALYLVLAAGELRMSELAARLGITSSTATGVVDGLVSHGLLTRHEDPADRRQVVVSATAEAEATLESFRELNSRRMREMLAHVNGADLAIVERALRVLDAAVAAETGSTTIDPQGDHS